MGKNKTPLDNEKLASLFFDYLKKEHNISEKQLETLLSKQKDVVSVPISILRIRKVGSFEAIVKYLRDNLNYGSKDIAQLTNRSRSTISVSYHNANKKLPKSFPEDLISSSKYSIPISLFASREFSVLETIVAHLKEDYELNFSKIAQLLNRDDRTIWTVYDRASKKRKNGK